MQVKPVTDSKSGQTPSPNVTEIDLSVVYRIAGLSGRLEGYTFENWDDDKQPKAKASSLSFFDEPKSLVFWSTAYGSGKTFAACAILRRWLRQHVVMGSREQKQAWQPARYYVEGGQVIPNGGIESIGGMIVIAGDMLSQIKATYRDDSELTEADIVGLMQKTPLLVLDDLAYHAMSANDRSILHRLVNWRYNEGLHMIVTTNRTVNQLMEDVGAAVVSRLRQMGEFVHLDEEDYRE